PTWSEESAESVQAVLERYVAPWLVGRDAAAIEPLRLEMARRVQGNPFARAAVEMALWDLNGRALGVPVHRLLDAVRDRGDRHLAHPSAGPKAVPHLARHRAVELRDAVRVLRGAEGEGGEAEARLVGLDRAERRELVPGQPAALHEPLDVTADELRVEDLVAGRHRRVRREHGRDAQPRKRLLRRESLFLDVL